MTKKLSYALLALLTMGLLTSCYTNEIGDADYSGGQVDEHLTVIKASGEVALPEDVTTDLVVRSIVGESTVDADGNWQLKALAGNNPQLIFVANEDGDVLMMRRGPLSEEPVRIDAESSALAMVTMHPLLAPITSDYTELEQIVSKQEQFPQLLAAVSSCIDEGRELFDFSNDELVVALSNVLDGLATDPSELLQTTRAAMVTRAMLAVNSYPLHVNASGNRVTLSGTEMSPSYYGTVTGPDGEKDISVKTTGDYSGLYFIAEGQETHAGQETTVTFSKQGDYRFHLSCRGLKGYTDLALHLTTNIIDAIGLGNAKNAIVNTLKDEIENLANDMLTQKDVSLADYGMTIVKNLLGGMADAFYDPDKNWYETLGDVWNDLTDGTSWAPLKGLLKIYNSAWDFYDKFTNAANAAARVTWWFNSPAEIDFCLCYNATERKVESCTEVSLTMVSGDGQEGEARQRLLLPLKTKVETRTDQGLLLPGVFQKVQYKVMKGNGSVSSEIVGTDGEASVYWTLGDGEPGDEQLVEAVVIDMATGEAISDPVTFTAKVKKSSDITVRLDWHKLSGNTDIDLHVIDPFGTEIYYAYPSSYRSGGWLDRDDRVGPGPEHIYFTEAPAGNYQVKVHYYTSDSRAVTTYRVTVVALGESHTYSGSIAYHQMVPITTITIPSTRSGLLFADPQERPSIIDDLPGKDTIKPNWQRK